MSQQNKESFFKKGQASAKEAFGKILEKFKQIANPELANDDYSYLVVAKNSKEITVSLVGNKESASLMMAMAYEQLPQIEEVCAQGFIIKNLNQQVEPPTDEEVNEFIKDKAKQNKTVN